MTSSQLRIRLVWIIAALVVVLSFMACSNFESFALRVPVEVSYGDTAVKAEQAAEVAKIEADKEVMKMAGEPHTVNVKLPPEMQPAFEIETPPELEEHASGMATMHDGRTLTDCVETKGGTIECLVLDK
jgi:hypothetical protein